MMMTKSVEKRRRVLYTGMFTKGRATRLKTTMAMKNPANGTH